MAPPPIDDSTNASRSSPTTLPFDGRADSVRMPKLAAVAVPVTAIVSVIDEAVRVMLPLLAFTVPEPPVMVPSAVARSPRVETWPGPKPNVMVSGGLPPIVKVSVWPAAAALCVIRLLANLVPTDRPSSVSSASVLLPPIATSVSALPLVSTSWLEGLSDAVTPCVPVNALIAASTAVSSSPARIVMGVPLMSMVPPAADERPERSAVPSMTATASGFSAAPNPRMRAGAGGPATGLAEKFAGLSSSDRATSVS